METPPQATIARRRSDRLSIAFPVSNNSIGDVKRVMSRLKEQFSALTTTGMGSSAARCCSKTTAMKSWRRLAGTKG